MKYLLLKLVEEAGELVVAAIKHRLHRTPATLHKLEGEVADVLAIIELLIERDVLRNRRVVQLQEQRYYRELKRMQEH